MTAFVHERTFRGLSFNMLRQANTYRLPLFANSKGEKNFLPDGSNWEPSQWLQALVGEIGEFANFRKKFERGDITGGEFLLQAKKELADVQIYLDLLAHRLKINLGKAVIEKFNEVSRRVGANVFIKEDGDWYAE